MNKNEKLKIRLYKLSSFLVDSFVAARRTVVVNALIAKRTLARIFPASANLLKVKVEIKRRTVISPIKRRLFGIFLSTFHYKICKKNH